TGVQTCALPICPGHRRQTLKVLDHPVQIHCRRAARMLAAIERAVAALLMFQSRPGGEPFLLFRRSRGAIQFDLVIERMFVVEGDPVLDRHSRLLVSLPIRPTSRARHPARAAGSPGEPGPHGFPRPGADRKTARPFPAAGPPALPPAPRSDQAALPARAALCN